MQSEPQPWLSILIPVYNVSTFLADCLSSVVAQLDPGAQDVEIIALDDASTDNSLEILKAYSATSLVKINVLMHTQNRGLSAARNTLLNTAKGKYIWFLDSDDVVYDIAISELKSIAHSHSPDLVMCDFRVVREKPRLKHRLRGEHHVTTFWGAKRRLERDRLKLFEGIYRQRNLHIWSKISKRELWGDDLRFPEGRVLEDMVVTPRLALRVASYYYEPSVWVGYRQREGSILSTTSPKKVEDMSVACAGVLDEWLQRYPNLSNRSRLHFAYFCAKTHITVARDLRQMHGSKSPALVTYRARFFAHIRWSKTELYLEYLKRGWILRLRRFLLEH